MGKAQFFQIEAFGEGIDKADRVLLTDVVIQGFREEGHLIPVVAFDVTHLPPPGGQAEEHDLPYTTPDFSHRLSLDRTGDAGRVWRDYCMLRRVQGQGGAWPRPISSRALGGLRHRNLAFAILRRIQVHYDFL
jgi:hypothetical protein